MIFSIVLITALSFNELASAQNVKGRPLVVLATPQGPNDTYYGKWFDQIVDFQKSYANLVKGKDNILIIAPDIDGVYDKLACEMPGYVLKGTIKDIWMRDIGASRQKDPILFKYWPNYIEPESLRTEIRQSYLDVLKTYGVEKSDFISSELIVDGGNYVGNGQGSVVATSRIYSDNRESIGKPRRVYRTMRDEVGWDDSIAVIPEVPGDTTGHADGMVSFIDTNKLAFNDMGSKRWNRRYLRKLRRQLPKDIDVFTIPNIYVDEKFKGEGEIGFTSACGLHINALSTTDYLYVPTFGHDEPNIKLGYTAKYDTEVLDAIKAKKTSKEVVEVPVDYNICRMGGSVRCLSWQVEGDIADKLVAAAQKLAEEKTCP